MWKLVMNLAHALLTALVMLLASPLAAGAVAQDNAASLEQHLIDRFAPVVGFRSG